MATTVGARVTAESGPVFINLPVPGTKQSVCSWPNVVPIMPAERELDGLGGLGMWESTMGMEGD